MIMRRRIIHMESKLIQSFADGQLVPLPSPDRGGPVPVPDSVRAAVVEPEGGPHGKQRD